MPRLGTTRELAALVAAADYCEKQGLPLFKELRVLHVKLTKPGKPQTGAPIAAIEKALVAYSNGRVLSADGGQGFWIAQSRRYGDMHADAEQAELVGKWMARQPWLSTRSYTVDSLVFQWPNFLARAKAEHAGGQPQGAPDAWARPDYQEGQ